MAFTGTNLSTQEGPLNLLIANTSMQEREARVMPGWEGSGRGKAVNPAWEFSSTHTPRTPPPLHLPGWAGVEWSKPPALWPCCGLKRLQVCGHSIHQAEQPAPAALNLGQSHEHLGQWSMARTALATSSLPQGACGGFCFCPFGAVAHCRKRPCWLAFTLLSGAASQLPCSV